MPKQLSMIDKGQISLAQNTDEIGSCFSAMQELRLKLKDKEAFIQQIQRQQKQGYLLVF